MWKHREDLWYCRTKSPHVGDICNSKSPLMGDICNSHSLVFFLSSAVFSVEAQAAPQSWRFEQLFRSVLEFKKNQTNLRSSYFETASCNIGWHLFPDSCYRKLLCFHAWVLFCELTAQMFFMSVWDWWCGDACSADLLLSQIPMGSKAQLTVPITDKPGWWFVSTFVWDASWSRELFCAIAVILGMFLFIFH